jgi:hypothetical protein
MNSSTGFSIQWCVPPPPPVEEDEIEWEEEEEEEGVSRHPKPAYTTPKPLTVDEIDTLVYQGRRSTAYRQLLHTPPESYYRELDASRKRARIEFEQRAKATSPHPSSPVATTPKTTYKNIPKNILHTRRMGEFEDILNQLGVPFEHAAVQKQSQKTSGARKPDAWSSIPSISTTNTAIEGMFPASRGRYTRTPERILSPDSIQFTVDEHEETYTLMEYAEERPLFQPLIGMEGMFIHLHRKSLPVEIPTSFGLDVGLEKDEPSPLLSEIQPGKVYTIYRHAAANIPVFDHTDVCSSDFLLLRGKDGKRGCHLKPIRRVFTCGQVEPTIIAFSPTKLSSTKLASFLEHWILYHLYQAFTSVERISERGLVELFPYIPSKRIEKQLKEVAIKDGKTWVRKLADSQQLMKLAKEHQEYVQPLDVLRLFAYMDGMSRIETESKLKHIGSEDIQGVLVVYRMLHQLLEARVASERVLSLVDVVSPEYLGRVRKFKTLLSYMIQEVEYTPWFLSHCCYWLFRQAENIETPFPKGTIMQVYGNPNARFLSFLPTYRHLGSAKERAKYTESELYHDSKKEKTRKKTSMYLDSNKSQISGTENDIRTLSMKKLGELLMELGFPEEKVCEMRRWDRTWLLRKIATDHPDGAYLKGGLLAKYIRPTLNEGAQDAARERTPYTEDQDERRARRALEQS